MLSQHPLQRERRPRTRAALMVFLAASAAVHAAVIVALPDLPLDRAPPPLTVLEVVLVQSGPARPLPVADAPPELAPKPVPPVRRKAVKPRSNPKRVVASPPVEPEAPLLTLPESAPAAELVASAEPPDAIARQETDAPAQVATVTPMPPSFSASYLQNPAPRYPLAARRAGEQGTVTLRVLVSTAGLPQSVDVETTSGSPRLDAAALDAVRRWRFAPARRGAAPIESWVLVPVVFRLENPS